MKRKGKSRTRKRGKNIKKGREDIGK